MTEPKQLPLFEEEDGEGAPATPAPLQPDTLLEDAIVVYLEALRFGGSSPHTIRSFKSDLNLLSRWAGFRRTIGSFATQDLNRFLHWLLHERGKPCSPKSTARRITTLKNFFGWLYEENAIPRDPSAALIQKPASSPLPEILFESEIKRVLEVTQRLRQHSTRPDARPHLLVTLLLQTGIKKGECMALYPGDVDRTDPREPFLWIRYDNPRLRYKERKIPLSPEWPRVLDEYLAQRQPPARIFNCTARNLEYVLRDVADKAGVPRSKLSFEGLRWTCAYRDYRDGMDQEELRQKLGLSRISWRETSKRLEKLLKEMGEQRQSAE